ncbi:MAG TPA: ATP-binding protein [Ktedonobacterales bacterium]|nr:ATP-binding protein [Ktedonobacterales bacterium]
MDRMRDRLDKIARRSMSAPAGSSDALMSTSAHPSPARQYTPRQSKAPIPRSPANGAAVPARPVTLPSAKRPQQADARAASKSAPQPVADALGTDRILELPARVTVARKQRQLAIAADVTPSHASERSEPPQILPVPERKSAARARADVAPIEPPEPVALPLRGTPAKSRSAAMRTAPERTERRVTVGALTSTDLHASGRTDANDPLPENVESVGGAMQRFMTVLAERRRQRALGGGDGGEPPRSQGPGDVCPICGGAGYVRLDVPVGDPRFGQPVPCKCKEREFEERRHIEEERRVLELDRFFSLKPFGDKSFETFNPRVAGVKEAYEAAQTFAEDPTGAPFRWLVLMGGTGVGKTHLAAAIAHERLEARSSVFFAVVPDLLDHLRAAFAPSAEMPYNEMFETVREVEMLILDDLGSENSTAWATEKLFQIINYRYNYRMPTVITTNSRLFEHMDERIASRLADTSLARTVVIEAQSRRANPIRKQAPPGRQAPPRW